MLPTIPGFLATIGVVSGLPPIFARLYDLAWFVGVAVSSVVYCLLMRGAPGAYAGQGEGEQGPSGGRGGFVPTPGDASA